MKPISFATLFVLLISCSPATDIISSNQSTLIKVECKNEKLLQASIHQILRLGTIADWDTRQDGHTFYIQARYEQLSEQKAEEIKQRLMELPGVLDVEIKKDGMPLKRVR